MEYPPTLQAVPVKPFFFDIAYNYIGAEEKPEEKKFEAVVPKKEVPEENPERAKRGWFWR